MLRHLRSFDDRKVVMRGCKTKHPKPEREAQQRMVDANNGSADNEFLICDIEYTFRCAGQAKSGRIDLVAARRPSPYEPDQPARLAIIELKCGVGAIDGRAGLRAHMNDLRPLMAAGGLDERADEMIQMLVRKRSSAWFPRPSRASTYRRSTTFWPSSITTIDRRPFTTLCSAAFTPKRAAKVASRCRAA